MDDLISHGITVTASPEGKPREYDGGIGFDDLISQGAAVTASPVGKPREYDGGI